MSAELLHYMYRVMVFQSRLAKTVGYKFYIVYARLMDVNGGRFLRGSLSLSAESYMISILVCVYQCLK